MQMTVGEILDKIDAMRIIVRDIESGGDVKHRLYDIAEYLDEYIQVLSNTKVHV